MPKSSLRAKILLIGDGGVGKSSFRRAWLGETFRTQYIMTLGADFAAKEITQFYPPTNTYFTIKYQIWDLAGQPRFKVVSDLYYRGAVGALCFFDITDQGSFTNLMEWINSYWNLNGQGKRPLLIIGAKSDLRKSPNFPNQVSSQHGLELADRLTKSVQTDHKFSIYYVETSAKENINVEKAFQLLGTEVIKLYYQMITPIFQK
ncbi:MAG: GTP-binding protein [Candidatus Heimdallarchaeota archaeon]|nr:MAG: GTP-binding protein [Candidatus Heimdallarchaeota archaeon]